MQTMRDLFELYFCLIFSKGLVTVAVPCYLHNLKRKKKKEKKRKSLGFKSWLDTQDFDIFKMSMSSSDLAKDIVDMTIAYLTF